MILELVYVKLLAIFFDPKEIQLLRLWEYFLLDVTQLIKIVRPDIWLLPLILFCGGHFVSLAFSTIVFCSFRTVRNCRFTFEIFYVEYHCNVFLKILLSIQFSLNQMQFRDISKISVWLEKKINFNFVAYSSISRSVLFLIDCEPANIGIFFNIRKRTEAYGTSKIRTEQMKYFCAVSVTS